MQEASAQRSAAQRLRGHFCTITRHKFLVMGLCFRVGLYKQGLLHDMSKYSPTEFWTGVRYYQGTRSPNAAERDERGFTEAWLHHKGRNKHHYEYWIEDSSLGSPDGTVSPHPAPMPTRYVVEMFCDRVSACKVYQKGRYTDASALQYFQRESLRKSCMHPDTQALLVMMLTWLAEEGETAAVRRIRREIVRSRYVAGEQGRF